MRRSLLVLRSSSSDNATTTRNGADENGTIACVWVFLFFSFLFTLLLSMFRLFSNKFSATTA